MSNAVRQQREEEEEGPSNGRLLRTLRWVAAFAGVGTLSGVVTAVLFIANILSLPGKVRIQGQDIDSLRSGQAKVSARQDTVFQKLDRANARLDYLVCIRQGRPEVDCAQITFGR